MEFFGGSQGSELSQMRGDSVARRELRVEMAVDMLLLFPGVRQRGLANGGVEGANGLRVAEALRASAEQPGYGQAAIFSIRARQRDFEAVEKAVCP